MSNIQTKLPTVATVQTNGNGSHKLAAQQIADTQELRRLQVELERLRAENTELRKRLRYNANHVRIAQRAKADAMLFVADILADKDVSRAAMEARHDMSRRRWEYARAALKAAGMTDSYYRLKSRNAKAILHNLNELVERIEEAGRLDEIVRNLPRCRSRERWTW